MAFRKQRFAKWVSLSLNSLFCLETPSAASYLTKQHSAFLILVEGQNHMAFVYDC